MAPPDAQRVLVEQGGSIAAPSLLGQGPARIPTGGRIRAGIKVLTRKAAEQPQAQAIYDQGVAAGRSFEQIERAIAEALPDLKTPLAPRNVQWFTVRPQDFANPEIAGQIRTGVVAVNSAAILDMASPFGGFKEREKQKLMLSMGEPDLSRGIAQQIVGDSYRGHLVDVANNVQKVTIPTL